MIKFGKYLVLGSIGFAMTLLSCSDICYAQRELVRSKPPVGVLPPQEKRFALVVGIDKYEDPQVSSLTGAANDARALAAALIQHAGFPKDQVILMTDGESAELRPTRTNIRFRLSNLLKTMPKDGLLLISFAGHGIERDGKVFLLPTDARVNTDILLLEDTSIAADRIKESIRQSGVKQVVVLLDACRNNPEGGRGDTGQKLTESYTRGFSFDRRNSQITAFAVIYATAKGQVAFETKDKKQGYFTLSLVEGIKGAAKNEKGEVTLAGLVKYIQDDVPKRVGLELGKQQVPFAVIEGYKANDLVLAFFPVAKTEKPAAPTAGAKNQPPLIPNVETPIKRDHPLLISARSKFRDKNFDGAISDLTQALAIDASNAAEYKTNLSTIYFQRGIIKFQQANYEGAVSDFTESIQLAPTPMASVFNARGVVKSELKLYDQAIADFNQAIALQPNEATFYVNRGDVYKRNGSKKLSDQDYDRAQQLNPLIYTPNSNPDKNPLVVAKVKELLVAGQSKANQGNYDGAISDFSQAITLNPKNPTGYWLRAFAKANKGYVAGFVMDLENANSLGKLKSDDYKMLVQNSNDAIRQNPRGIHPSLNLALLHFATGGCGDARKEILRSLEIEPNNYSALMFQALMRPFSQYRESYKDLDKAIKLKPKGAPAYLIKYIIKATAENKYIEKDEQKALENAIEDWNDVAVLAKRFSNRTTILFYRCD